MAKRGRPRKYPEGHKYERKKRPKKKKYFWEPHPGPQTWALQRSEFEVLYGGARGGGKTEAGIVWLIEPEYVNHPLYRGLVIRRNSDDLRDWIDRAKVFYGGAARFAGNPVEIRFPAGGVIRTGHLKDESSYSKYLGHEYQKILIEELTLIPSEELYLRLISSCRSTVPELRPQVFATTNPGGPGHSWVKKRFVDVAYKKTYFDPVTGRSRIFIPAKVTDNPTLIKNDPQYFHFLQGLPDRLRRAWLEGDWDAFEGQFFTDFSIDLHGIEPFYIPPDWILIGSLDPGWSSPCSFGLNARDYEGNIYRLFTYYERNRSPEEHAEAIMKMLREFPYTDGRLPHQIVAGWDAFEKPGKWAVRANELTFERVFRDTMRIPLVRAKTDRVLGWWTWKQAMRSGKWKYFLGFNDALVEEITAAEHDEKSPEDLKGRGNDPNVSDHALDEARYAVMSIIQPVRVEKPKEPDFFEKLQQEAQEDPRVFWDY